MMKLLEEVLGRDGLPGGGSAGGSSRTILIKDCVETSGRFLLHHLIKTILMPKPPSPPSGPLFFLSLSEPFSHYDRILRKLGCNLVSQRDSNKFIFFDMLRLESVDKDEGKDGRLSDLYGIIHNAVKTSISSQCNQGHFTIMVDDISLLEIVAHGDSDSVLDFLHYCQTLTSEEGCLLILLGHQDIYANMEFDRFLSQVEHNSDVVINVEPLALGLATDVHGQLTVERKGIVDQQGQVGLKNHNFHFRIKENCAEYFHPGNQISMNL
ncbi:Elongator complex protein 6 [Nymphaea thermarum]|nr:Elongator complex protein 6 [Nymphaea thermarum]